MTIETKQQSEMTDHTIDFEPSAVNDYKFMTSSQKAKWKKLASLRKELSSIKIVTTNTQVETSKMKLDEYLRRTEYLISPENYNVVFLGASGQGKSTILNVLIGRDILPVGESAATTGTINFIEAIQDNEHEKAIIHYSTSKELKKQIKELAELGGIGNPGNLLTIFDFPNPAEEEGFIKDQLNTLRDIRDSAPSQQKKYSAAIWDIVNSYRNHYKKVQNEEQEEYLLPEDLKKLGSIINEKSNYLDAESLEEIINLSSERRIRLISHVNYYLNPSKSSYMGMLLKNNIRVVDVPGFGDKNPVHEIITKNVVKNMEPMIALVISTEPRIADDSTIKVCEWINKNYISMADNNSELKRAISESIFLVVNNSRNVINEEIDENTITIDQQIRDLISQDLGSPNYFYHFNNRGQNSKPYILVTPLPAAYLQRKNNLENTNQLDYYYQKNANQLEGYYSMFYKSLSIPSHIDTDRQEKYILDRTGIPNLSDQFLSFLENRRVDIQIERAYKYLNSGLDELGNSIHEVVGTTDSSDPILRAKKILVEKDQAFQTKLIDIRDKLFVEFGKENEPVQPFVDKFSNSLMNARKDLEELIKKFDIKDYINVARHPINGIEVIETTRAELGSDIDSKIQKLFRTYAKDFADELIGHFELLLNEFKIKSQLIDITYDRKYFYSISTIQSNKWVKDKVNDIEKVYNFHINSFKNDYIEAFRILTIYELLRDNKRSAFSQLTEPVQRTNVMQEEVNAISNQVRDVIKEICEILDDSDPANPLFRGLRKHFFYLYVRLKDDLGSAYSAVIDDFHMLKLASDRDLVRMILEENNEFEDESINLSETLVKLEQISNQLSDL